MKKIVSLIAILVAFTMCFSTAKAATKADIDIAIADGLEWLKAKQNKTAGPDFGSWGYQYYKVGKTSLAVTKFEHYAIERGINPLDPSWEYYPQVKHGLDYIFSKASIVTPLPVQTYGDPDTDGDNMGVTFGDALTYETGIALMAIAESNCPDSVVDVPGSAVDGWTYDSVAVNVMNWLAYAQEETGNQRGGWRYSANSGADQSNSGYATLGLGFIEVIPPHGFGITVPRWVKDELGDPTHTSNWIDYIQNDWDGGSGYTEPNSNVSILETGNLLFEMAWYGNLVGTGRVQAAIGYLVNHWHDVGLGPNWPKGWVDCYQAMFTMMKGLEAFGIDQIDGIDWFDEVSDTIVVQQHANGSWGPGFWDNHCGDLGYLQGDTVLTVCWALLTLQKAAPALVGIPDQCVLAGDLFEQFDADTFVIGGTPPFTWTWSGNVNLTVTKDANNVFTITYPPGWIGSETITFTAVDALGNTVYDDATFTVDPVPLVGNIPDQAAPFVGFDLDDYLYGIDPSQVTWTASGMSCLVVDIDPVTHVTTVTNPGEACTEAETITFTATATACEDTVTDEDEATFTPMIPVAIDIKPRSCPNPFRTADRGVLPVAILGTEEFDVTTVDPSTVEIEGVLALRNSLEDVSTPIDRELDPCACTTEGADGFMDMTLKFDNQEILAALDSVTDGEIRVLTLTGATYDGVPIEGQDCVKIIRKKKGVVITDIADVARPGTEVPNAVSLGSNYPNPFNPQTEISFSLPERTGVSLVIYNILGEKVKTLLSAEVDAGVHTVHWDGMDESGNSVASGIYFYKLTAVEFTAAKRMVLIK